MEENIKMTYPKEFNMQKNDVCKTCCSNSQFHYKDISNFNYEHRIKLNPLGESNSMDIRNQIPLSHIQDSLIKTNYLSDSNRKRKTSFEKANIQSNICSLLKKQKYQTLLKNDKHIENLCNIKNRQKKNELERRKNKLKEKLTIMIKDALLFSRKNNPIKSMLPDNINEILNQAKKQTEDMSFSLNISNLSNISTMRGNYNQKKNEFLSLLGVDLENLNDNHINIDINKAWDYVLKLAKDKNIEDFLRYKVVNSIMSLTEKKASEKARKIYEKMEIYNKYMKNKKIKEINKKQKEEEDKYMEMLKNNPKELIKLNILKSLSQPKLFNQNQNKKKKTVEINKNKTKSKSKKLKKSESSFIPSNKKYVKFNAYNDINNIINFIENSQKESQSKLCKEHFMNIKMTKSMDINLIKMLKKNSINLK